MGQDLLELQRSHVFTNSVCFVNFAFLVENSVAWRLLYSNGRQTVGLGPVVGRLALFLDLATLSVVGSR